MKPFEEYESFREWELAYTEERSVIYASRLSWLEYRRDGEESVREGRRLISQADRNLYKIQKASQDHDELFQEARKHFAREVARKEFEGHIRNFLDDVIKASAIGYHFVLTDSAFNINGDSAAISLAVNRV